MEGREREELFVPKKRRLSVFQRDKREGEIIRKRERRRRRRVWL